MLPAGPVIQLHSLPWNIVFVHRGTAVRVNQALELLHSGRAVKVNQALELLHSCIVDRFRLYTYSTISNIRSL